MRRRRRTRKPSPAENRTDHPKRRSLSHLVTTERIEAEMRNVGSFLKLLDDQIPPTQDEQESRRRSSIRSEVATHLLIGFLIVVKEYLPAHYRALTKAALVFGEARLAGRNKPFIVRHVSGPGGFATTLVAISLATMHEELAARVGNSWKAAPPRDGGRVPRLASSSGRYTEPREQGYQRRQARDRMRAGALQAAIRDLMPDLDLDDQAALRLVRSSTGAKDLSLGALARLTKQAKRTVKARAIEGRKLLVEAARLDAILEQRGYVRPGSVGAPIR